MAPRQRSSLISVKRRFRRYHPVGWPRSLARLTALLPLPFARRFTRPQHSAEAIQNPLVNVNIKPHMTKTRVDGRELDRTTWARHRSSQKFFQIMAVDRHVFEPNAESTGPASPRSRLRSVPSSRALRGRSSCHEAGARQARKLALPGPKQVERGDDTCLGLPCHVLLLPCEGSSQ